MRLNKADEPNESHLRLDDKSDKFGLKFQTKCYSSELAFNPFNPSKNRF